MYNLAAILEKGDGIEQNLEMAVEWYTKAEACGDNKLSQLAKEKIRALKGDIILQLEQSQPSVLLHNQITNMSPVDEKQQAVSSPKQQSFQQQDVM